MSRRMNGEGHISVVMRNNKKYYRGIVTVEMDGDIQKRKTFNGFKKQEVLRRMREWQELHSGFERGKPIYFGDWYLHWIKAFKEGTVQETTLEGYYVAYEKHIKGTKLEFTYLSDITLDVLQSFYRSKEKDFTANQVHRLYVKINSALESAVLHSHMHTNYSKGVKLRRVEHDRQGGAYKVFSKEEQKEFMDALDLDCNIIDNVIYFTLYTGLRLGEVLALRWEDFDGKEISINEQYQRSTIFNEDGTRKTTYVFKSIMKTTSSKRSVPLPAPAIKLLEGLAIQRHTKDKKALIFALMDGEPIGRKRPDRRVKTICRKLKIPERNFHSLRHTYATRLFESGVEPKTVQTLLGHSDIRMTLDIYTHVMQDTKDKAMEALDSLF